MVNEDYPAEVAGGLLHCPVKLSSKRARQAQAENGPVLGFFRNDPGFNFCNPCAVQPQCQGVNGSFMVYQSRTILTPTELLSGIDRNAKLKTRVEPVR